MAFTPAPQRSPIPVVLVALVSVLLVLVAAGIHSGAAGSDGKNYVSEGGVDVTNGTIRVNDAWLDAPTGVPAGGRAPMRVELANDSGRRDALRGVSTPVAAHVDLIRHGMPVRGSIDLKPWRARDLEWPRHGTGIELVHLNRPLEVGQWFPITFRFEHSAPITVPIAVGPLAP